MKLKVTTYIIERLCMYRGFPAWIEVRPVLDNGKVIGSSTMYKFNTEDGTVGIPGDELVEYDGEVHTAANLYDALKEGYYGKL